MDSIQRDLFDVEELDRSQWVCFERYRARGVARAWTYSLSWLYQPMNCTPWGCGHRLLCFEHDL